MMIYEHTLPTMAIGVAVTLAAIISVLGYWLFVKRDLMMAVMMAVRVAFFALLAWCLLLPGERKTQTLKQKPRFVVLMDTTKSMLMTPPKEVSNRWSVAMAAMNQPWVKTLAENCDIDCYAFTDDISKKNTPAESRQLTPNGDSTLLRDVLKKTVGRYAGVDVTGCLLLSDGIDTREVFSDWAIEPRPFPIHTLTLEKEAVWDEEPDVRIDTVTTPRRVTVGWQTELKAVVSGQGTKGQAIDVQLFKDGILEKGQQTQIPAGGGSKEVVFQLDHAAIGFNTYRLYIPPFAKEVRTNDNEYTVTVQVVDAKNRLLYVEGPPRWESKYLTRVLRASQQITPVIFLRGAEGKFMTFGVQGNTTPDMKEQQLAFFKMVILGNLDGEELGEERAQNLLKFVEAGGSLVLLGGSKGWGADGFAKTSLKKLLPAKQFGSTAKAGEFTVSLTDQGRGHPSFAGDPTLWDRIPPVLSVFPDVEPSPAARVLVVARTAQDNYPLILTQDYGQGKVVAVFTDSLWKWQLTPDDIQNRPYQRFWDQLISWLSPQKEKATEKELEAFVDREQVFVGEEVEVSARWSSISQPPPGIVVGAEITSPDGRNMRFTMTQQSVDAPGAGPAAAFSYKLKAEQSGSYAVVAVTELNGKQVASDPISFVVKPFTPESLPRPVNNQVLQAISQNSGGRFFETVDALNQELAALKVRRIEQEISEYHTLWQRDIILVGLIGLLAAEWLFRKLRHLP